MNTEFLYIFVCL